MCGECKKELDAIKRQIGADVPAFMKSHGFENILHVLSYLLEKDRRGDKLGAKVGQVRPAPVPCSDYQPDEWPARVEKSA